MGYGENMQNALKQANWQDYRGNKEAVAVFFESSISHALPIRDVLNESGKGIQSEPHIETLTYGFLRCVDARMRNSFVKNRKSYVFFIVNYQGTEKKYVGRDFIIGYYRIMQTADAKKIHFRNMEDEMCPELDFCHALRATEAKFVGIEDAFELTVDKLKEWGYKGKLSRQLKLAFNEQKTAEILAHFALKKDLTAEYVEAIGKAVKQKPVDSSEEQTEEEPATASAE